MPTRHSLWLLLFASSALFAQQSGLVDPGIIYQRAEQRQQQINRNAARQDFSTLDFSAPASEDQVAAPGDRHACTSYQHIVLDAPSPSFLHYLEQSVRHTPLRLTGKQTYHKAGECIRAGEVIDIVKATQNRLIEDGWITTRVVLQTEGSHKERLKLTVLPGKIAQVRENKTNVQRTPGVFNYLQNKTINLRDLEQSLDNVHRLGSLDAQVDIAPSDREGYSDLVVNWQKTGRPYQFSFLVDDSGSKSLGKYLGTASIYIDNPLNFSDTFYASYTRTLRPGTRLTDQQGKKHKTLTDNYYLNYSIPWRSGSWGSMPAATITIRLSPAMPGCITTRAIRKNLKRNCLTPFTATRTKKPPSAPDCGGAKTKTSLTVPSWTYKKDRQRAGGWELNKPSSFLKRSLTVHLT